MVYLFATTIYAIGGCADYSCASVRVAGSEVEAILNGLYLGIYECYPINKNYHSHRCVVYQIPINLIRKIAYPARPLYTLSIRATNNNHEKALGAWAVVARSLAEATGMGVLYARRSLFPMNCGYVNHMCVAYKVSSNLLKPFMETSSQSES